MNAGGGKGPTGAGKEGQYSGAGGGADPCFLLFSSTTRWDTLIQRLRAKDGSGVSSVFSSGAFSSFGSVASSFVQETGLLIVSA